MCTPVFARLAVWKMSSFVNQNKQTDHLIWPILWQLKYYWGSHLVDCDVIVSLLAHFYDKRQIKRNKQLRVVWFTRNTIYLLQMNCNHTTSCNFLLHAKKAVYSQRSDTKWGIKNISINSWQKLYYFETMRQLKSLELTNSCWFQTEVNRAQQFRSFKRLTWWKHYNSFILNSRSTK